jgi:hypothetical protein
METISLGRGNTWEFWSKEFATLNLRDKRLNGRAIKVLHALQNKLTSCVRRLFNCRQDMRQAYDFFSNPKVNGNALFTPHQTKTAERVAAEHSGYVLAIQDNTHLNYTKHKAKTELGRIGGTRDRKLYGLIQHSTLCVTEQNELLGLMDLQFFHHDDRDTKIHSNKRPIEEKQSDSWLKAYRVMKEQLGGSSKTVVTIADREGDFFDFLKVLSNDRQAFIIRSKYDRYIGPNYRARKDRLFAAVDREEIIGDMTTTIYDVATQSIKTIVLKLKRLEGVLLPPVFRGRGSIKKTDVAIAVNAVMAYNEDYLWVLLTSLPVKEVEDVKRIVTFYRCRWHIENFHKILKTAYQIEQVYLHTSRQAVENILTLAAISACRFYWILYVGRHDHDSKANRLFEPYEWEALYTYFKEPLPLDMPRVADVVQQIARLGGYKARKHDGPPGIKTLWLGFQQFTPIANMYQTMTLTLSRRVSDFSQ